MIGIVGGVGPYAGIDFLKAIYDNTLASKDQDYLNTLLLSFSSKIQDRTAYLIGTISENPGIEIAKIILILEKLGATFVGIPCNTAHAHRIFSVILEELNKSNSEIIVLNMIKETVDFIASYYPNFKKIGILSTTGTYKNQLYRKALSEKSYLSIEPTMKIQEEIVHQAIYHPEYGIKSKSNPFHPQAKINLELAIDYLRAEGAEAIILGCTEMPLVIKTKNIYGLTLINPTEVLARKLIQHIDPKKLKPLNSYDQETFDFSVDS